MKRGGRLLRRLGLDGNPLRRRTDKIASYGAAGLLALYLAGAPAASLAVAHWGYQAAAAEQRAQQSWRQVPAVVTVAAPDLGGAYGTLAGYSWTTARWTAPSGGQRTGMVPVPAGSRAGSHVTIWVNRSGAWTGAPLTRHKVTVRVAAEVAATPVALGIVLVLAAWAGGSLLRWRRLASWGDEWARFGPQWTRQFRARGW